MTERFKCPWCETQILHSGQIRRHKARHHPEEDIKVLERSIIMQRYPDFDLDQAMQDYVDKKETVWTLKKKGYRLMKYIRMLGILRSYGEDVVLMRIWKNGSASIHDNPNHKKVMMEKYGVENASHSQELLDKALKTKLKNQGLEELFPAVKTLQTIKKARKAMAVDAPKEPE